MEPARVVGRYRVLAEVARGGSGAVYRAVGPDGREVALKLILGARGASAHARRRVLTEVQSLLRLRHPHVVALLDAGEHEGAPYLVMEWVQGETLGARLSRQGPLDPRAAVELARKLGEALAHCHGQGVLHRDLKPDNVLLRARDGQPLLVDFGISQDALSETQASHSRAGLWLGTPGYWPPEQARGARELIGPRSDVYGLGALLYAALTGHPPQEGATLQDQLQALERPPRAPSQRRPGIPRWLDAVCLRALAPDPAERYPDARGLAQDLYWEARQGRGSARAGRTRRVGVGLGVGMACLVGTAGALLGPGAGRRWVPHEAPRSAPRTEEGPTAPQDAVAACMRRGEAHRAQGRLADALEEFQQAAALDPQLALAHVRQGDVLAGLERHADALPCFARALALDPNHLPALLGRANAHVALGQHDLAVMLCDQVLAIQPGATHALAIRGTARLLRGRPREAIDDFDLALRLDPKNLQALTNRGKAWVELREYGAALESFERVMEVDPTYARAYSERAQVRADLGESALALEDMDQAIALAPDDPGMRFQRAWLLEGRERLEEALADYDQAVALDPRSALFLAHRARVRGMRGRLAESLADCEQALALDPSLALAGFNRGIVLTALGRAEEAVAAFGQVLGRDPAMDPSVHLNRAKALEGLGRRDEALADYERALLLEPGASWAPQVQESCGRLRVALGGGGVR